MRQRYPAFQPPNDVVAVWEPRAGILFPELAVQTHLELASRAGATLQFYHPVLKWRVDGSGVGVTTVTSTYSAQRLLLSAGPWISSLIPELNLPLSVERQVLFWFKPSAKHDLFQPEKCPIFIWEYAPGRLFYGFPDLGDGIKVAIHHEGEQTDPDLLRREVGDDEVEAVRALLEPFMPGAAGPLHSTAACMYTNTPDGHFILGHHPACPQVVLASPCSGHGFKFSPVIGEIAAMLLEDRVPSFDLSLFAPDRFIRQGFVTGDEQAKARRLAS